MKADESNKKFETRSKVAWLFSIRATQIRLIQNKTIYLSKIPIFQNKKMVNVDLDVKIQSCSLKNSEFKNRLNNNNDKTLSHFWPNKIRVYGANQRLFKPRVT